MTLIVLLRFRIWHEREVPPRLTNVGYRGLKRKKDAQDEFFSS
jgi:hypothetical protein